MRPPLLARAGTAAYSCAPVAGVSVFGRYSSIADTATGFWAVAQYGASATDCAFGTAWVNFGVLTPSGWDLVGDDGGVGHPPGGGGKFTWAGCGCRGADGGAAPMI